MIITEETTKNRNDSSALDLVVENAEVVSVFSGKTNLDALLKRIRDHATSFVFDPKKPGERDACRSLAYKVARSKTAIDAKGKEIVANIKKKAATIDALRKAARDDLDALKQDVLAPVNAWEAEQARIEDAIADIIDLRDVLIHEDTVKIERRLNALDRYTEVDFGDRAPQAEKEIATSRQVITDALQKRKQHDAEQAELARLRAEAAKREEEDRRRKAEAARKEREAQIAKEAAEKAARETEERLQRERDAAEERARKAEREKALVTTRVDPPTSPKASVLTLREMQSAKNHQARIMREAAESVTPEMLASPEAMINAISGGHVKHVTLET